jgi:hypothetical protein
MAAANFEDSAIFKLWGGQGVQFEPDAAFASRLRYQQHPNGDLIKILYGTEQQWSRKRREAKHGADEITAEAALVRAAKGLFPSGRFIWHANKSVSESPFGETAERLPNRPHGLNAFADIDNVVFLSSLNPPTDHFRFLESRGLHGGEVRAFTYYAAAYQAVMRTSIRNPDNRQPKTILVPDRGLADYLYEVFPGSKSDKLDVGIGEGASRSRGRPRRHNSDRERVAQQRQKARERKLEIWKEQLRLNSPDTVGESDCGGNEGRSRAKNVIRLYTNFGTGPLTATLFWSINTSIPDAYASGDAAAFVDFLQRCHERRLPSKEDARLFAPAIFDPNRSTGTNRGNDNIAYLCNVVLDFENGALTPEEIPNLFPGLRMVVTNTFHHTSDKPRFRVFIPTTERMTPEAYGLIYNCLAEKLEDAGYSVDRRGKRSGGPGLSNSRPSGLDWSQSLPTSLFYLPCQAEQFSQSFFHDHSENRRQPLSPSTWLENIVIPFQPEFEPVQPSILRSEVNVALIESATEIWRGSKDQPGRGDEMFFNLALALRRAGLNHWEVESTLRSEAEYGRSPKERLRQIPSVLVSLRRYSVSVT